MDSFKVLQWNINGYINNYNDLLLLIKQHSPKVICLQETHLHSEKNIPIPINFTLILKNTSQTRYGGVCTLIHKSVGHKQITISNDFDAICVQTISRFKFNIFNIYINPQHRLTYNQLSNVFGNLMHRNWGSAVNNRRGNIIAKFINDSNYLILNDSSPTHISTHSSLTHVDITFCSSNIAIAADWCIEKNPLGSDHFPITTSLFPRYRINSMNHRPKYQIDKADWKSYQLNCTQVSPEIPLSDNINKETGNICKIIHRAAQNSVQRSTSRLNNQKSVPWWNAELEKLKSDKNKAWDLFDRNMSQENLINFKRARARFKRIAKQSKNASISDFTSTMGPSSSTEKIWSNVKTFTGYKKTQHIHCIATDNTQTNFTEDKLAISDILCEFWSNNSKDENFSTDFISRKRQIIANTPLTTPGTDAKVIEDNISYVELESTLQKLKGKSPGLDRIPYSMVKKLPYSVKQRVLRLYNKIFVNYIPQQFKSSILIPIPKPNSNKSIPGSYRPISLNPCLAKILDKIISNRLWWFVLSNKLLDSHQYGFKKGNSTTDALLYVDHQIATSLSLRKHLTVISLDFEKAYDKIGVHSIIDQLVAWNVGPNIIKYVVNFMTNRKIVVRVGTQYSGPLPLSNGIPQGSPLSVILFLIAYDRLCKVLNMHKEIQLTAFADDFNIIVKSNNEKCPLLNLSSLFHDIETWCKFSGAVLSRSKCKYIHFCRKKQCKPILQLGNFQLQEVNDLKILGLIFNNRYKWNNHIEHLASSLSKQLNIIKCLANRKFNCNTTILISITKSIILSKIIYCLPFFGHTPNTVLRKLKTIINSAIRVSLGAFRSTPISNMLIESNILPLELQRNIATTDLFRSILKNSPLKQIAGNIRRRKRYYRISSTLQRIVQECKMLQLPTQYPKSMKIRERPVWKLAKDSIDISLSNYPKNFTSPLQYKALFLDTINQFRDYQLIFTDGSRNVDSVGYSVVNEREILMSSILPYYASIFSAEIIAILEAIKSVRGKNGKFIICSDSMSSLKSILNVNNNEYYSSMIRNFLIDNYPKVKLFWVPGHTGIPGNEFADMSARNSLLSPLILTENFNIRDINGYIREYYTHDYKTALGTSDWYKEINLQNRTLFDYLRNNIGQIKRSDQIKIIRLRLGHTNLSHCHLMNQQIPNLCNCNIPHPNNLNHLLISCPKFSNQRLSFPNNLNAKKCLANPTIENMLTILHYLKTTNIYNLI